MSRIVPADARLQILDALGESVYQALGLKEALQEERKALEAEDADALQAIVETKNTCAERLQALDAKRSALCEEWDFTPGPHQMTELIEWCDDQQLISSRWEQLMVIAAEGSALNMTNGAIIRVRQQQIESSLSVLRGVTPGSDTYGRNGEEQGDFSQRSLAEA